MSSVLYGVNYCSLKAMKTRKILFLLCTCALFGSLLAQQNKKLDSLLAQVQTMPSDTVKVIVYGQLCRSYAVNLGNFTLAGKYLDSLNILSDQLRYENGRIRGIFLQGLIDSQSGNYGDALINYEKASQLYLKQGDSVKALYAIQGMAQMHSNQGDYEKSLELLFMTAEFYERKNTSYSLAVSYSSIANLLRKIERYEESIEYHKRSLDILKAEGYNALYAMGLQNLANVYAATGDNSTALELYKDALPVIQQTGNKYREAYLLGNMGFLLGELNQIDRAIEYQLKAVAIWKELSQPNNVIETLDNLGSLHLKLKKYNEAKSYYQEALPLAKAAGSKTIIASLYGGVSEVHYAMEDYKNAYLYKERSMLLKDSILNIENTKQINELQAKYETERKDRQIENLAAEKVIQEKETQRQLALKNTFIAGGVLIALLGGLVFYILKLRLKNQKVLAKKDREINEINFKRQLSDLEMKALQAQINPHFIFNCMSSINDMILEGDNQNASKYLTKFSKLIRLILENAEETEVSLKNELSLLEAYIQLEVLRFKGNITYNFHIDDHIDTEDTYLPGMALQPFVENAIWHGLQHKKESGDGLININIAQKQNELICTIEDNGVGRDKAFELQKKAVWKSKSLGLKITEERLKLLSKEFEKQLIRIIDLKDKTGNALGTKVEVSIPISQD